MTTIKTFDPTTLTVLAHLHNTSMTGFREDMEALSQALNPRRTGLQKLLALIGLNTETAQITPEAATQTLRDNLDKRLRKARSFLKNLEHLEQDVKAPAPGPLKALKENALNNWTFQRQKTLDDIALLEHLKRHAETVHIAATLSTVLTQQHTHTP